MGPLVLNNDIKSIDDSDRQAYLYTVMPFHIMPSAKGSLFGYVNHEGHSQDQLFDYAKELEKRIQPLSYDNSTLPGDLTKYYDFMQHHYGSIDENKGLSVFKINRDLLKPTVGFEKFKNANAQFQPGALLGQSSIRVEMDTFNFVVNSLSGIGFFICNLHCYSTTEDSIVQELTRSEFFRNIGWRRNQPLKSTQLLKHAFIFNSEKESFMTFHDLLECYFSGLSDLIHFYQDRPTVLYCTTSMSTGSKSDTELCEISYEVIRVPDRNAGRFLQSFTEPSIHRIGGNVVFTALNEGAIVVESANNSGGCKNVANKYFPAFIFALNQREVLLNTMQQITMLDSVKLRKLDGDIFNKMENLRKGLLVLQLKQIFYTVSNLHEVELFFNQLQRVFAVEKMLMENEQCIREMFNLLEVKRNEEVAKFDKENTALEEERSKIINTILGAIGCLGLFSFLKDLWPFIQDSQYALFYKLISVLLPGFVMIWLVWYMAGKKK